MLFYNVFKFLENPYREDRLVKVNLLISLIVNIITWAALYVKLSPFSYLNEYGQIYLHYNIYFGIDNIGNWYNVFIIPILGLFFIVFNNILALIFYLEDRLISYFLVFSQTLLQLVLLIAAIFVILLNI